MNKVSLNVDINSIISTKKLISSNYNELVDMLSRYREMIDDTVEVYDTESATVYRKIATEYVDYINKYLNNFFKPYIDNLDVISNKYTDLYNVMAKQTNGGQHE